MAENNIWFQVSTTSNTFSKVLGVLFFLWVLGITFYLWKDNNTLSTKLLAIKDNNLVITKDLKDLDNRLWNELFFEKNKDFLKRKIENWYINQYIKEFYRIEDEYSIRFKEFNFTDNTLKTIAISETWQSKTADQILVDFVWKYRLDTVSNIKWFKDHNQSVRFNLERLNVVTWDSYYREFEVILSRKNKTNEK